MCRAVIPINQLNFMSAFKRVWPFWIHIVVAGMLLWALRGDNTYGYYTALRWLVFLFFCFLARVASECNERKIFWIPVAVVLIYNPFVKPPLWSRDLVDNQPAHIDSSCLDCSVYVPKRGREFVSCSVRSVLSN